MGHIQVKVLVLTICNLRKLFNAVLFQSRVRLLILGHACPTLVEHVVNLVILCKVLSLFQLQLTRRDACFFFSLVVLDLLFVNFVLLF